MISGSLMLLCASGQQTSQQIITEAEDRREIHSLLEKWPHDFNEKKYAEVCALFAPDLIATYPESPDKNFDAMCQFLKKAMFNSEKTYRYEAPQIDEILVSGHLAVVRLNWTLRIINRHQSEHSIVREKGIDIFKRQNDGTWKIAISYAFPS